MKPIEVFIKYAKIRGIIPFIKARERGKVIQVPDWHSWDMVFKDFKTFANEFTYHNGFYGLFSELEYYFFGHDCSQINQDYNKALRLWTGFVNRNIFLKNAPKEGDKLTLLAYNNREEDYKFLKFYDGYRSLQVKSDSGRTFYYNVDRIKKLNGEPYELDFYIKWKRKTYGID
jgi:hypothetical protein